MRGKILAAASCAVLGLLLQVNNKAEAVGRSTALGPRAQEEQAAGFIAKGLPNVAEVNQALGGLANRLAEIERTDPEQFQEMAADMQTLTGNPNLMAGMIEYMGETFLNEALGGQQPEARLGTRQELHQQLRDSQGVVHALVDGLQANPALVARLSPGVIPVNDAFGAVNWHATLEQDGNFVTFLRNLQNLNVGGGGDGLRAVIDALSPDQSDDTSGHGWFSPGKIARLKQELENRVAAGGGDDDSTILQQRLAVVEQRATEAEQQATAAAAVAHDMLTELSRHPNAADLLQGTAAAGTTAQNMAAAFTGLSDADRQTVMANLRALPAGGGGGADDAALAAELQTVRGELQTAIGERGAARVELDDRTAERDAALARVQALENAHATALAGAMAEATTAQSRADALTRHLHTLLPDVHDLSDSAAVTAAIEELRDSVLLQQRNADLRVLIEQIRPIASLTGSGATQRLRNILGLLQQAPQS